MQYEVHIMIHRCLTCYCMYMCLYTTVSLLGVGPLSYYLMNGVLNFNIVFVLALLAPLAVETQVEYLLHSIRHNLSMVVCVCLLHVCIELEGFLCHFRCFGR